MSIRKDAQEFLKELYSSIPRSFYNKLETTQRGIGFALNYLKHSDGEVIAGDLSKNMNVSTARISALLNSMEHSGLITRHSSLEDARRTVVKITPAGIALVDEMSDQTLNRVESLLDKISKEDLDAYIRISHQIREIMED